jgi:hypothetical protein
MTAPDAAEIRAFIKARWQEPQEDGLSFAESFSDCVGSATSAAHGLWEVNAFRTAEEEQYDALISAAVTTVQRIAEPLLIEALAGALVQFAAEHPDAPRSRS